MKSEDFEKICFIMVGILIGFIVSVIAFKISSEHYMIILGSIAIAFGIINSVLAHYWKKTIKNYQKDN